jgi:hypothetical protein
MRTALLSCLAVLCLCAWGAADDKKGDKKTIKISGFVRDAEGKAVAGAEIMILNPKSSGKPIVMTTDDNGRYEKEIESPESFDLLYSHSEAGRSEVCKLSGAHDQNISIILYNPKQVSRMTPEAAFDELQAFERAAFLARYLPDDSAAGEMLRAQLADKSTSGRLDVLSKLTFKNGAAEKAVQSKASQVRMQLKLGP